VSDLDSMIRAIVREELAKALAAAQPANDEYLDTAAAAAFASVTSRTICRWVREGRLEGHHAGTRVRVKRSELVALLERGTRAPAELSPEEQAERDFG